MVPSESIARMDSLREYLLAVVDHWFFWFGGIMLVVFELVKRKWKEKAERWLSAWVFWGVVGVCLFIATFQAWHDDHSMYLAASNELSTYHGQQAPDLEGTINQVTAGLSGKIPDTLLINLTILNKGADTIVRNFRVEIYDKDVLVQAHLSYIPDNYFMSDPAAHIKLVLHKEDAIYEKTTTAISRGSQSTGYLLAKTIGGVPVPTEKNLKVVVSYEDYTGKRYNATTVPFGINVPMQYIPGSGGVVRRQ